MIASTFIAGLLVGLGCGLCIPALWVLLRLDQGPPRR